ncbi:MAG: PQQ-dependent dehydrogenase, methanol/ethanol family [Hyphomicrobiales bacterium]|nr:PQQ-dependent dehydrogenase, methanol/ethanol family [Hyphomicrobiales bacterium]
MKHPSLSRKSAIFVNIFLILILTISIIFSSYSLNEDIQFIDNEGINNITKEEIIGNINQSRIINADSEPHNWLAHGRDYNEQRFSPLKKINKENISQLELEWSFDMDTTRGLEATPIVDNGVMFVTNAWSTVHAIDAKTGKELWFYDPNVPRIWSKKACCDVVNRGVAVWKGFVFSATLDGRLLKLDAKTGKLIWEINTITNRELDYTITGAPRIANDKIFIGNGGADMGGVRGYVSAYDTETGKLIWRFYTIPGDPSLPFEHPELEEAAKTWNGEWWTMGGGGTAWNSIVYDPDFNQLYIGTGNGQPWNIDIRSPGGGDNLYLSSIIALNADTGKMNWYYQTTPEDKWDFTATQDIMLADMDIDGETKKVLMQAPKNGFFYVIDRKDGKLLRAHNYVPVNWSTHINLETGRPIINKDKDYNVKPEWVLPGSYGGHNWQAMSYDPNLGLVYIPTHEVPAVYVPVKGYYKMQPGTFNTGTSFYVNEAAAKMKGIPPVTGAIKAFNPITGETKWSVPHNHFWNGGTLSTLSGLTFQGNSSGNLVAYDSENGSILWSKEIQTGMIAPPVTYQVDGEQYISILAGDGGAGNSVGDNFGLDKEIAAVLYGNYGRLLSFKLNGKSQLPKLERKNNFIPEQPIINVSEEDLLKGEKIYAQYCGACHGAGVRGKSIVDLRHLTLEKHKIFNEILLEGILEENGMANFSSILTEQEVNHVHNYIIDRATKDRIAEKNK